MIGLWITLCGTIFVNRQKKDQVASLVEEMSRKLKEERVSFCSLKDTPPMANGCCPFKPHR